MTTYTAVMPYAFRPYRDAFMRRCKLDVYEIDNTERNLGIMRSHNLGIDRMRAEGSEWLIVLSVALRFGKPGGLDFIDQLAAHDGHHVVEAAGVYGWHLVAFHRDALAVVGRWDVNFSPYGFDDIDMSLRYQAAFNGSGQLWDKVPVDVRDAGMAHSIKLANVQADAAPRIEYFVRKWGRHPGASHLSAYERPFNNPRLSLAYWPPPETGEGDRWDD